MLNLGLTGGIGAGKSVVARRLARLGAVVIDADLLAQEAVAPGSDGLAEVVARFGRQVIDDQGELDRAALAARVFEDDSARRTLENIIHPRVRARSAELVAGAAPDAIVVNDVPLLVEVGLAPTYHLVIVVEAAPETRVARLVRGRDMTEEQAWARIRAQADDTTRRAAADVLLTNDGELDDLHRWIDALWCERLVPYEENIRLGRMASRPARAHIVPYDPTWPEQYARLAARIRHAAGPIALRVDHVGSTAVPGLVAKDVIDIQVTVADLAAADELAEPLATAGFPRAPGRWQDTPRPSAPDPQAWEKRVHGGADPARPVNLHVRAAGSPGWRLNLLLRDWFRGDAAIRDEYVEVKRRLASLGMSTGDYAVAKEPWFDEIWQRAERWARETGWTATA